MMQLLNILAVGGIDTRPLPHVSAGAGTIQDILTIVFSILGAIALLIVVLAGIKYITSQGDPQGVSQAKRAIIYAVVGLIVVIFAQIIVGFVLGRV